MTNHSNRASGTALFKSIEWVDVWPRFILLGWLGLLLLLKSTQQSLMAHDEGIYANQARMIVSTGDWVIDDFSYDRTIGIQCLIALCFWLFGVNEGSARLPSEIAAIIAVLLTYNIGCLLLNRRLAFLGSAVLSVTPLWILYSRLATQDATLVLVELLGIWSVLKLERERDRHPYWALLSGATVGLGFFIKGFMIIPAVVALLPYSIRSHWRSRVLTNLWVYLGVGLGFIPIVAWLVASSRRFGAMPVQNLFDKFFHLSGETYLNAGPFYYLWNIPANAFPWALFSLIGLVLVWRHPAYSSLTRKNQTSWLLVGYPLLLFVELSLFRTRTHYYPLQLLPFMGLLAGITLDWLVQLFQKPTQRGSWRPAALSYAFGGSGLLMVLAGIVVLTGFSQAVPFINLDAKTFHDLGLVMLVAGPAWIALPILWLQRRQLGRQVLIAQRWLMCWLLGPWLALAMLGLTGVWGNFSPDLKSFLEQPAVVTVLQSQPVHFVLPTARMTGENRKIHLLLKVYTPQREYSLQPSANVQTPIYAWLGPGAVLDPVWRPTRIAAFKEWQLLQIMQP